MANERNRGTVHVIKSGNTGRPSSGSAADRGQVASCKEGLNFQEMSAIRRY